MNAHDASCELTSYGNIAKIMKLALLVIDMQHRFEGIARGMRIVGNVVGVMHACHKKSIPVFITQHHDPEPKGVLYHWWKEPIDRDTHDWRLIPEIMQAVEEEKDTFITEKTTYDSFHETLLKEKLEALGVDTVVVTGVMTNLCCETTARAAFVNNYSVIFLRDGNATSSWEFHNASLKNLKFGFAVVKTCKEFIDSLQDYSHKL